jgi:ATP-dependent helicase/nuclease subunit B
MKPLWSDVYSWYKNHDAWQKKCEVAEAALEFTNQVKTISKDKVQKLYGSSLYSSVSRFEKYVSCPFSYYIQYGLKATERRIYKLNSPDVGTFMHAVIERFSRTVSDGELSWREIDLPWCTKTISDIVDEMLEKMQGSIMNGSTRYINLSRRLKRVLVRAAWLIAEHIKRSSFEPIGYEVGFGDKEEFPPITIELTSGAKINLTGRIDRVDAFKTENGTYLRIIDYKSGTKAFKLSDVFYGMQIQLITYLDAIWENGREDLTKPIIPGGMLYFRIDDPIIKSNNKISEEDVEKAIIKQLKMKGLLLADVKLIREMDNQIDGNSIIIPARINKGDVLGKSSSATLEQFEVLRKYVKTLLTSIGEEMLKGDIPIKPFKNKRSTPCTYCDYSAVCQFDPTLKDNKYRVMNDKKDEDVWEEMGHNGRK